MEEIIALGTVSSLITILDKGLKLAAERLRRVENVANAHDERIEQTTADLRRHCEQAKAFLEHSQDPLVNRIINAAEEVLHILVDLQSEPSKNTAIKTLNLKHTNSSSVHEQNRDDSDVTLPYTQHTGIVRQYGATYLSDNARAHIGDVNNVYLSHHYYATEEPFPVAIEALRKEVKDCSQLLPSRLMVLMAKQSLSKPVTEDPAKIRRATLEELANKMKHTLWYPELHSREEHIMKAHDQTFEWVFSDPQEEHKQSWHSFIQWLQEGQGVYWINGKAGSGKSTLINYIKDDDRTIKALEDWAKLTDLVTGSFFFWNSGTPLEKSLEGLYRSLIFQVLQKAPETVNVLFKEQEMDLIKNLVLPSGRDAYWSERKLAVALSRLASSPTHFETYCFFIDGLDEFDGDHNLLVEVLEDITSAKHIKVCCSSRPLPIFMESFAEYPSLRLQDLTASDIRLYVDDELKNSRRGRKLAESNRSEFKSLVSRVVDKSAGVFLWVYLVVRSLQSGLRNEDTVDELRTRIDDSPEDLLNLFRKMVINLEPRYKAQGALVFRTLFAAPDNNKLIPRHTPGISILELYLAAEEAVLAKALLRFSGRTQWKSLVERVQQFEQRVAITCCGLLEFAYEPGEYRGHWLKIIVPEISPVIGSFPRLLHQSVQEFLTDQKAVPDFSIEPQFEDYERLLAARLILVKSMLRPGLSNETIHDLADYAFSMCRHVEKQTGRTNTAIVEEIYRSCSECASITPGRKNWLSPHNQTVKDILRSARTLNVSRNVRETFVAGALLDDVGLLEYAIAFGMYVYADSKISKDLSLARRSTGVPLLHIMTYIEPEEAEELIESKGWQNLARKLLENGADPNLIYRGQTAWGRRLNIQAEEGHSMKYLGNIPEDLYFFIRFGADVNQSLCYKGMLGPLSTVEGQPVNSTVESFGDNPFADISMSSLSVTETRSTKYPTIQHEELYRLLEDAIDIGSARPRHEDEHDGSESEFDISTVLFVSGKILAAQRTNLANSEGQELDPEWSESDEASILVFPFWEISLHQWVTECLIQTDTVKAFGQMLVEEGAANVEPKIVHYFAERGKLTSKHSEQDLKKKLDEEKDENKYFAFESLNDEQSSTITAAWRKAFPNYILAGFPRELHRLLSLIDTRVDAPGTLGARGTMPVTMVANGILYMLAAGAIPTTGIVVDGKKLDYTSEAVGRIIGAMEFLLRFGNRLDEFGGTSDLIGIAGPEELQKASSWGESQACNLM